MSRAQRVLLLITAGMVGLLAPCCVGGTILAAVLPASSPRPTAPPSPELVNSPVLSSPEPSPSLSDSPEPSDSPSPTAVPATTHPPEPVITTAAPPRRTTQAVPPPPRTTKAPPSDCDPNYSGCVPIASDVDCAGGSGNGPAYVQGPVRVIGSDIYDLDRDNDGVACE